MVYVKYTGGCMWYKYYCRHCKKWYKYTTAWNYEDYNMCKHSYQLPVEDERTVADNSALGYPGLWVIYGGLKTTHGEKK
jgi:hypothetical protein